MKGISNRENPIYLYNGGESVATSVLNNGEYKITESENGSKTLDRYNAEHKMWVQLQFTDMQSGEGLAALITETLKGEYLKNALSGDIESPSKHLLTSGEISVTIPSTEEREG